MQNIEVWWCSLRWVIWGDRAWDILMQHQYTLIRADCRFWCALWWDHLCRRWSIRPQYSCGIWGNGATFVLVWEQVKNARTSVSQRWRKAVYGFCFGDTLDYAEATWCQFHICVLFARKYIIPEAVLLWRWGARRVHGDNGYVFLGLKVWVLVPILGL